MILAGVAGLCVAVNSSEYTLWSVPNIDSSKTSGVIKSDKVVNIKTPKGIFKDVTL